MAGNTVFEEGATPAGKTGKTGLSSSWVNAAFLVEALVLLAAIVAAMAVFSSLFANAAVTSKEAEQLTQAVQAASNAAEEFSHDPAAVAAGQAVGLGDAVDGAKADGLSLQVSVESEPQGSGMLYSAHITVSSDDAAKPGEIYALDASRYVKGAE